MKDSLVIRLTSLAMEDSTELAWFLFDAERQLIANSIDRLHELAGKLEQYSDYSYSVTLIIPGDAALLCKVRIPSKSRHQIQQALPYMVEELIAEDIENVHMAIPAVLADNNALIDVGVIAHAHLIQYQDVLYHCGLAPDAVLVDVLCLPLEEGYYSVMPTAQGVLIRTGPYSGVVAGPDVFTEVLQQFNAQALSDDSIEPALGINHYVAKDGVSLLAGECDGLAVNTHHFNEACDEVLAATALQQHSEPLNFLQGGYRVNRDDSNNWQSWRFATFAAVAAIAIFLLNNLLSALFFDHKALAYEREQVALYKKIFPNERRVPSPKRQMQSHLQNAQSVSGIDYMTLVNRSSAIFKRLNNQGKLSVEQLRFDESQGYLRLEIKSQAIEPLDELKRLLGEEGLLVKVKSAVEVDGYVLSQVEVGGA